MDAELLDAAAALRWARPDLTAELADHVLEEASAADQQDRWLAAAGWALHARVATGDGRDTACGVLAALPRWGDAALTGPAARRLRIELAMVAAGAGEVDAARRLLAGVRADDDPELTADLLCAHARCAVEDAPDEVAAALDAAEAAWTTVGGAAAQLGGASVALVRAVVERRAQRPAAAVDHAADGLARLERGRSGAGTRSSHLAAALAAEWISALLDAGRLTEAAEGCNALLPRLSEKARPTRQLALLRLTVTRALAAQDPRTDTAELIAQAADDAAGSGVPDLEAVCRTALGALHEQAGQVDIALAALQLAVEAERTDRARARRFLAAIAELPADPERPKRRRARAEAPARDTADHIAGSSDATTVLPAITRSDRKLRSSRREEQEREKPRFERPVGEPAFTGAPEPTPAEEQAPAWGAVPWGGDAGDSPIGDLLLRSFRNDPPEPVANGAAPRNGKSVGAREQPAEEPASSSSWVPTLDPADEAEERPPTRRRGRYSDSDRRRSRRAREERAEAAPETPGERPEDAGGAGEQEGRSRRRSRHRDDDALATNGRPQGSRARHGSPRDTEEHPGEGGRRSRGTGGTRRRPDTAPAETASLEAELWSPAAEVSEEPVPATPAPAAAATGAAAEPGDSDDWLQSALAELDRALSGLSVGGPPDIETPFTAETPAEEAGIGELDLEEPADHDGCAVVVDIARDGRRFAGPRAAAVVRSVADLIADRLPEGGRSRFGDADALVVTRAGWSRADATDWMHRTLPTLLDGFATAEELPGAQLRVAVHDADGPVGAQILQPLTTAREAGTGSSRWADASAGASEERGQKYRAAARAVRPDRGSRARPEQAAALVHDGALPRWPFSGHDEPIEASDAADAPSDATAGAGRHGGGRTRSERTRDEKGERSHRYKADDQPAAGQEPAKPTGSGRAARRRSAESASNGAAGNSTASNGSAGNGSAGNGSVSKAAASNRAAGNGSSGNGAGSNGPAGAGPTGNGVPHGAVQAPAGAGRRAKPDENAAAAAGAGASRDREPERAESTEGLGLADLLAGALAAYRGI
ncbi:hypothetical protein [Pseudonocardia zijingensis]|uniref:hypothetical protein n=1 Tax=Pseudonocardia zijingensis TaxID=153376 RepID=UPI00361DC35E